MRIADRGARLPRPLLVELFAIGNLAFLSVDVFIAHSINAFRVPAERIPVGFGASGAALVLIALALDAFDLERKRVRWAGYFAGWIAIVIGVAGLFLHLRSTFFEQQTLKSLVYTAPFAAPLAFAGLGFLLLMNRMVAPTSREWGGWVVFLAWGGFVGNFALSLADHAQNGFFDRREWIPVAAAAFAVGFLLVVLLRPSDGALLRAALWVMALEVVVGVLGFAYHVHADLARKGASLAYEVLFGAPPFAPLLFADIAALAALGLWDLSTRRES